MISSKKTAKRKGWLCPKEYKNLLRKKLKMTNLFDYHIKDSRELTNVIKEPIVDVVITSPPYWNLKDYGTDNQIGFGQKYESYLEDLTIILDNCKKILKNKGSMWIIVDSFKQGGNIRM